MIIPLNTQTHDQVSRQLAALRASLYEVGVLRYGADGKAQSMTPRIWTREGLERSIGWLQRENALGGNINIRPKGVHQFSVIDDLKPQGLEAMKASGFHPCCVVETSKGNYHAWVNHGLILPEDVSTAAAKELASRFGGDPSAANWRHFGRLAGFTNRKPSRRMDNGLYPFCKLTEATPGLVYPEAKSFVPEMAQRVELAARMQAEKRIQLAAIEPQAGSNLLGIEYFRDKLGAGHEADFAFAKYAQDPLRSRFFSQRDIEAAITSRDLSHKGPERRQQDYIKRTIEGAARSISKSVGVGI